MCILSLVRSRNTRLVKGDHTLNTGWPPEDQFKSLLWWIASCDECTNGSGPAFDEDIEVLDSGCEGLGPGVHCSRSTWFFNTMSRIRRAGSASINACRPGTPVSTKIPLIPSTLSTWSAKCE